MKMRSKMQNEKGFTLVELMVVVVILGILVAIAVPVYNNVTKQANQKSVEANLRTIDGAIMQYKAVKDGATATKEALENDYLQVWPEGPDKAKYSVVNDRAVVEKDGSGDWFNATGTVNGTGYSLPITWNS
jgi:type IV pilus assembly protein PilA